MTDDNETPAEDATITAVVLTERYGELSQAASGWGRNIFSAREPGTERQVHIAVGPLPGRMDHAMLEGELRREVAVLSRLQHRHITRLMDTGVTHDGRFFFVVEHPETEPLAKILEGDRLEPPLAYEIMGQALAALAAMHQAGVVHRGISPDHILLAEGEADQLRVVLGVGMARALEQGAGESESALERLGSTVGDPRYAAPEQLRGRAASPASDLYSWGLTLLECLTGASPYAGNSKEEVLRRQGSQEPIPIPMGLQQDPVCELLERVLHKDASRREVETTTLHQEVMALLSQELLLALGSTDPDARVATLRKLTALKLRDALWSIIKCLEDPEPRVRFNALRALDLLNARDAIAVIKPLLEDPDPTVRRRARLSWTRLLPGTTGREPQDPGLPGPDLDDYDPGAKEQQQEQQEDPTGNEACGSMPPVSHHTDISCPRKINSGEERASVVVRLTVDRPRLSDSAAPQAEQQQRYVKICLEAPDLEVLNDATQRTCINTARDSNPVTFDLRPLVDQKEETEIRLDFFQDGQPLGTVAVNVEIVNDEPTTMAEHLKGPQVD